MTTDARAGSEAEPIPTDPQVLLAPERNGHATATARASHSDRSPAERRLVTGAMMLTMSVAALEQTVVATAMPRIIGELGGGQIYPWVFSAYLLATTVSTPLYGKLADRWGRKRLILFGLGLFLLGSMLSGLAQSMPMLIAMRALQGLGAGALMPIVLTLLGDLYTLEERAKVQGYFSAVWGVASVAGPALGGVLTDWFSWRAVFFVPLPFGVVAAYVLAFRFHEQMQKRQVGPIDWGGVVFLTGGTVALLVGVLGRSESDGSATAAWLIGAAVMLTLFVWQERRAVDPILPVDLLAQPGIRAAIAGSFLVGGILFGIDTYVPLYLQGVELRSATDAGRVLTPLFLSWSISVAVAARVVVRFGFRLGAATGTLLIAAGLGLIVLGAVADGSRPTGPLFAAGLTIIGLGMGPVFLSFLLSVQNAVPWGRRGAATSAVTFCRTIGGALGVALLGAALSADLATRLPGHPDVAALLRADATAPDADAAPAGAVPELVRAALSGSLQRVFALMALAALVSFAWSLRLPHGRATTPAPGSLAEPH